MPFGLDEISLTYTSKWYMDSSSRDIYEWVVKCHHLHTKFCAIFQAFNFPLKLIGISRLYLLEWQYLPCYSFFTHSLVNLEKCFLTYFNFCACVCWLFQSCPTLRNTPDCSLPGFCPWNQERHLRSGLFFFGTLENTVFVAWTLTLNCLIAN